MSADETRLCPMCGATIKAIASKCRFCGEMLSPVASGPLETVEIRSGRFEPRGFLALFVVICPLSGIFFGLFWSLGFAAMQNQPFAEIFFPFGVGAGIFFGVFFGIVMAFMMRRDTLSVPFQDRSEFLQRLNVGISRIRYAPVARSMATLLFKPRLGAGICAGIRVDLHSDEALIVGPKMTLSKLLKELAPNESANR